MRSFGRRGATPLLIGLLMAFLLGGCLADKTSTRQVLPVEAGLPFASRAMAASFYQQETERWQAALRESTDRHKRAEAQLHLAALFLSKDNPQRDYNQAYLALSGAATARPDLLDDMALVNWLEILARLKSDNQQAHQNIVALEKELALAEQQIGAQRQQLSTLRETLDKLKRLELSVEKKRRIFK